MRYSRRAALPLIVLASFLLVIAAFAAERELARVGKEKISEEDMLFMISAQVGDEGDGMKTGLALVQMGERERQEMIGQLSDELLLAQAAKEAGLHKKPDTVRLLRWQEIRTLAGLYLTEASRKWDTGDDAVRAYYDAHPEEFMQAAAVKIKYLILPASLDVASADIGEADTLSSLAEKYQLKPDSEGFQESEWLEKGFVKKEFEAAFFADEMIGLLSPTVSDGLTYLIEVTQRREPQLLAWEESALEATQRLQRALLKEEIETLKKTHPVKIDEVVLSELGGTKREK